MIVQSKAVFMKITVLGTGAPFNVEYGPTQFMVQHGSTCCSVGFGYRATAVLSEGGFDLSQVTHVVIGSLEADEVGGLEELAHRRGLNTPQVVVPEELVPALSRRFGHLAWASDCPLVTRFNTHRIRSRWQYLGDLEMRVFATGPLSFAFSMRSGMDANRQLSLAAVELW